MSKSSFFTMIVCVAILVLEWNLSFRQPIRQLRPPMSEVVDFLASFSQKFNNANSAGADGAVVDPFERSFRSTNTRFIGSPALSHVSTWCTKSMHDKVAAPFHCQLGDSNVLQIWCRLLFRHFSHVNPCLWLWETDFRSVCANLLYELAWIACEKVYCFSCYFYSILGAKTPGDHSKLGTIYDLLTKMLSQVFEFLIIWSSLHSFLKCSGSWS